ncbi:MAG: hypothetical protein FJ098_11500, partial [Deltaproteobacteria bacterium]|nr:hypothetical protein [Deltaproteobacteria bacterium]
DAPPPSPPDTEDTLPDTPRPPPDTAADLPGDPGVDSSLPDLPSPDVELPQPPDIDALLEEGRFWLMNAEPWMALEAFEEALSLSPDDPDALFGAGLARFIHAAELLAMLTNLPSQYLGYAAGDGTREPDSANEAAAEEISGLLRELNLRFVRAEERLARIDDPAFSWSIERAPLYYVTRPMLVYRGRFDLGDVHLLRAVNGLCRWITALLAAQDLETDFAYGMVVANVIESGNDVSPSLILEALSYLLSASDGFLTLEGDVGVELFEDGAEVMTAVGEHILAAAAWIEDESPAADDVSFLEWDGGDRYLVLRNRVVLEGYEGTEEPLRVRLTDDVLTWTAELVASLGEPGSVVPFSRGPGLQLATILALAAKLGIVEQMAIPLPVDITHLEIDQIHTLLTGFLPDVLGFDWAGFHEGPAGLRLILPRFTDPKNPSGGWLLEWECPADLIHEGFPSGTGGLLCGDGAELVDAPHFVGRPWELPADGQVTKMPYMIWDDPTLGGLVYVDQAFGTGAATDWRAPDNTLLNFGVHRWLDTILGLL